MMLIPSAWIRWWLFLHECLFHTFLYMLYAYDYLSKSRIARTLTKYRSEGSNWWSLWVAWSENLTVCCENMISLVEMDRNRINGAFHGLLDYEMEYVSVMESKWLDVFFSHIYIYIYIIQVYSYTVGSQQKPGCRLFWQLEHSSNRWNCTSMKSFCHSYM